MQLSMRQLIQSPVKMNHLIHSPMKMKKSHLIHSPMKMPEETREQLIQSPVKMGHLMHSPTKKTRPNETPQETRPNETSLDQKICLVPNLGLGDLGLKWHLLEPVLFSKNLSCSEENGPRSE